MERQVPEHSKAKAQQVDLSDGVSKEEAVIIAKNYAIEKREDDRCIISRPHVEESSLIDGCWSIKFPTTWRVRLSQGLKWAEIHIDKKTGQIKASGWGPS